MLEAPIPVALTLADLIHPSSYCFPGKESGVCEYVRVHVWLTKVGSENGRNKWLSRCSLVAEPLPLNSETLSRLSHLSEPVSASIRGHERRHVST